jgi:hypothetical protein
MSIWFEQAIFLESYANRNIDSYICLFLVFSLTSSRSLYLGMTRPNFPFLIKNYVPMKETTNLTNLLDLRLHQVGLSTGLAKPSSPILI